jgi:hypothetical protein
MKNTLSRDCGRFQEIARGKGCAVSDDFARDFVLVSKKVLNIPAGTSIFKPTGATGESTPRP